MINELDCYDDLSAFAGELEEPLEILAQDLYHRLIEVPGSNLDDPDRGLGLEGALSDALDGALKTKIEAEFRKDPRVDAVNAAITLDEDGQYRIEIQIQADAGELGLVFDSSDNGLVKVS